MYNMDISILGYKFNLEVLILIGVVYLILVGHTVGGCCNVSGIMEGLGNMGVSKHVKKASSIMMPTQVTGGKEGFVGANINYGQSSPYSLGSNSKVDVSSWSKPDLTVVSGKPLSPGVKAILDRPEQPVPLPEGEMLLFANTAFKPECCPNTFSNSTGCACMTTGQYNYLTTRGGNNVPYSEY